MRRANRLDSPVGFGRAHSSITDFVHDTRVYLMKFAKTPDLKNGEVRRISFSPLDQVAAEFA